MHSSFSYLLFSFTSHSLYSFAFLSYFYFLYNHIFTSAFLQFQCQFLTFSYFCVFSFHILTVSCWLILGLCTRFFWVFIHLSCRTAMSFFSRKMTCLIICTIHSTWRNHSGSFSMRRKSAIKKMKRRINSFFNPVPSHSPTLKLISFFINKFSCQTRYTINIYVTCFFHWVIHALLTLLLTGQLGKM